ncbi:Glycine oxidase [Thalassocella blandensis]|nr:Glycine oxidase [Thalassocella blandensis]
MNIGIVGAGIMGRLLAWQLSQRGHRITLFERGTIKKAKGNGEAAAYTAAGMLTPVSEADGSDALIVELGQHALTLWPAIVSSLGADVDFQQKGSLILAHHQDHADLLNFHRQLARLPSLQDSIQVLNQYQLHEKNSTLGTRFKHAHFIASEAWLSPPLVLSALADRLEQSGCHFIENTEIKKITPGKICSDQQQWSFDWAVDTRGLGAKVEIPTLRGVRGEVIWLHAPEVELRHLVRLMHPRYRIYIVPRANQHFVIGATQIESDYQHPITVRSALELLSAAYSIDARFAEASIIETRVNCRPALPDNLPRLYQQDGLLRINGLFRHGFLIAPSLSEAAIAIIEGQAVSSIATQIVAHTPPSTAHSKFISTAGAENL